MYTYYKYYTFMRYNYSTFVSTVCFGIFSFYCALNLKVQNPNSSAFSFFMFYSQPLRFKERTVKGLI